MRKFIPQFQGAAWADGMRVLHAYLLPDLTVDRHLAQLVSACREAMRPFPITLLGNSQLHVTVEMVADTSSENIGPDERAALADALERHLAGAKPFQVTAGSPVANKAGALLDLSPDGPLEDLRGRVRDAFREARGPEVIQHDGGRHHLSLGYSWGTADSDPLQSALRRIAPSHAVFHVDRVHLLDVQFRERAREDGNTAWEISWTPVSALPLTT
ncbi:2'-5' RNA ligase family protein [Streptomyces sp. NPDC002536]